MSTAVTLLPDIRLPQTPEDAFPFRVAVDTAIRELVRLRGMADGVIAEYMGDRREAVVNGTVYTYDSDSKGWDIVDPVRMLALLTELQRDGAITQDDYDRAVTLTPQPDLIRIDNRVLNQLVDKRGLTRINDFRQRVAGPRKLGVKA